jgi:hypothetical protein
MASDLFGDLRTEKLLIQSRLVKRLTRGIITAMTDEQSIIKVGAKGYIHGWICVRPPCGKIGDDVSHPDHGNGKITTVDDEGMHAKFDDGASGTLGFRRVGKGDAELNDSTGEVRDAKTGDVIGTIKPSKYDPERYEVDGNGWVSYGSFNSPEFAAEKALSDYRYSKNPEPSKPYNKARDYTGKIPRGALSGGKLWSSHQGETSITSEEAKAVRNAWFTGGFGTTSDYMRKGKKVSARREAGINTLRDITSRSVLTKSIYTHRGVNDTYGLFGNVGDKVGSTFIDKNFVATSADPVIAYQYGRDNAEDAILHVHIPAGMSAFKAGKNVTAGDSQMEYLLPANTQFKIMKDEENTDGTRHIYLKVTGQPGKEST